MAVSGINIIAAGWLHRRSKVLHRWKRSWFTLTEDGRLCYYENEHSPTAEGVINIGVEQPQILPSEFCADVSPPETMANDALFGVETREETWYMCANDKDETMAWIMSLNGLKQAYQRPAPLTVYQPPPTNGTYQYVAPAGEQVTYYVPPGRQLVIIDGRPYYRSRAYNSSGSDACLGLAAGAALGSLFLWPLWMPWFMWC